MVSQRSDQDAKNDRDRTLKTSRQHQGHQLRLVADLAYPDRQSRDQECFHAAF